MQKRTAKKRERRGKRERKWIRVIEVQIDRPRVTLGHRGDVAKEKKEKEAAN